MATHRAEPRAALDADGLGELIESHGSAVAMVLLWSVPVLALLLAVLYA